MTELVFVYGTLRYGESNHRFLNDSVYVGKAETANSAYTKLHIWEDIPGVLKNGSDIIQGELYEVGPDTMIVLDCLEQNGDVYKRELVRVFCDGNILDAWLYFFLPECLLEGV